MKNLLIYTFCFFALIACKKSERLQEDETIVSGTVTEVQRGIPIEGAIVAIQEYYSDNDGTCLPCARHLIDSVLTDANGYYQIKFKAKKGAYYEYKSTCRKYNYLDESFSALLTKTKTNTANLSLIATGGLKIYFINNSVNKKLFVETVYLNEASVYSFSAVFGDTKKIEINSEDFGLEISKIKSSEISSIKYRISDHTTILSGYKTYLIEQNKYINDTIFF